MCAIGQGAAAEPTGGIVMIVQGDVGAIAEGLAKTAEFTEGAVVVMQPAVVFVDVGESTTGGPAVAIAECDAIHSV